MVLPKNGGFIQILQWYVEIGGRNQFPQMFSPTTVVQALHAHLILTCAFLGQVWKWYRNEKCLELGFSPIAEICHLHWEWRSHPCLHGKLCCNVHKTCPLSCNKPAGVLKLLPMLLTNMLRLVLSLTLFFFSPIKPLEPNSWFKVVIASLCPSVST